MGKTDDDKSSARSAAGEDYILGKFIVEVSSDGAKTRQQARRAVDPLQRSPSVPF